MFASCKISDAESFRLKCVCNLAVNFQIQYEITRVRQKMKELALLHDKHMNRPTLDDSSEEEHAIEITTQEITQVPSLEPADASMTPN